MIKFIVVGQRLQIVTPVVVSGTHNYITAEADFAGDEWSTEGLSKWAHFTLDGTTYDVPFYNDRISEIQHVDLTNGLWEVYITGATIDDDVTTTLITTSTALLTVEAVLNPRPFPPFDPSTETLVATLAHNSEQIAQSVRDDADDGVFNGATFTPHIDSDSILSWTNDKGLPNPSPVNIKGEPGTSIHISGNVETYEDLPDNLTEDDAGNAYVVLADGLLYVWDGTAFPADGQGSDFVGPPGRQGEPGEDGHTPEKGVDYFTETELAAFAQQAASMVTPSTIGAIANPTTKQNGNFLKYNGSSWVADNPAVSSVNSMTGAVKTLLTFGSRNVSPSDFQLMSTPTYPNFPYFASVPLTGVLSTDTAFVVYSATAASSGRNCPNCETYDGGVYIYAVGVPTGNVGIASIIVWR